MGKSAILILTIIAMGLPISVFHITGDYLGVDYDDTMVLSLFWSYERYNIGGLEDSDSGILEFPSENGDSSFFSQDAWDDYWEENGQQMMILWAATLALALLGFILLFFNSKNSGIFLILAAITSLAFTIRGYLIIDDVLSPVDPTIIPIPLAAIFFLIAGIMALKTEEF